MLPGDTPAHEVNKLLPESVTTAGVMMAPHQLEPQQVELICIM